MKEKTKISELIEAYEAKFGEDENKTIPAMIYSFGFEDYSEAISLLSEAIKQNKRIVMKEQPEDMMDGCEFELEP